MSIQTILFDLGNVIIPVSTDRTGETWSLLTGIPAGEILEKMDLDHPVFHAFEKGLVSPSTFRKTVLKMTGLKLSRKEFDRGWNAMVIGVYPGTEEILRDLGSRYRLGVLSNTNLIHERYCRKQFPGVFACFDKVFLSHRIGRRKPEEAAFRKVLETFRVRPEETLFLDDRPEMTDAAAKLGIHTVTVRAREDLADGLRKFGALK
jgi:glucose-1-phosphatase